MKHFKKLTLLVLFLMSALLLLACDKTSSKGYKDVIERPEDIPPLEELNYVKYPSKPENFVPSTEEGVPTIGTASTTSEYYKITQDENQISVKFHEVKNWDYVYLPINNYYEEYQNMKITATATNVKKVSVQAVYYEMYDLGRPAVTTLVSDVGDTEQFYIMEFGKNKLLDSNYVGISEEFLGSQNIIGLLFFIDSNPSQATVNKNTSIQSEFKITNIEFLKDGDPSLGDRYVDPSVDVGYFDPDGYSASKDPVTKEITINKYASAPKWTKVQLTIQNYSYLYSSFTIKFNTEGVKNFYVALGLGPNPKFAEEVEVLRKAVTDGSYEEEIDFSETLVLDNQTFSPVAGELIKHQDIKYIVIYLDTLEENQLVNQDATCIIEEISFKREVEVEGTIVNKGWNANSALITIGDDVLVGGIGSVTFNWYADPDWSCLTIPVKNYEPATTLTVTFKAPDGINYLGIALAIPQIAGTGEAVLKSCWNEVGMAAEKIDDVAGIVETIDYDSETMIYTITFDFTNAVKLAKLDNKSINEVNVTALRFYFTDPTPASVDFEGTRTIKFLGIEFK